ILEADIEMRPNWYPDASNDLPGEVGILDDKAIGIGIVFERDRTPVEAGAGANVEVGGFLVAEIEHDVAHRRIDAGAAIGVDAGRTVAVFVMLAALVAKLRLGTDQAPVVTGDEVAIDAHLIIDLELTIAIDFDVMVRREQGADFNPEIARIVAGGGRRRE